MGFFKNLGMLLGAIKQAANTGKNYSVFKSMTVEELLNLDDEALNDAVICVLDLDFEEPEKANEQQRIVLCCDAFIREVNNGGLCQFFVNSSSKYAPFVSSSLEAIDALMTKKLFDGFIDKTGIDLSDLSSFKIDDVDEYEAQTQRYPFDDFDDRFYEAESEEDISTLLLKYIRENIEAIMQNESN